MITYNINLCGGKNVWRIRQTRDIHHCERLWREGKYVEPKGYPISNANKWLGKLKKDKVIEI